MRYLYLLIFLFCVTLCMIEPPRDVAGQPMRPAPAMQDTTARISKPGSIADLKDSVIAIKEVAERNQKIISEGNHEIDRATKQLQKEVRKDKPNEPHDGSVIIIAASPDTLVKEECVYLRDSVYSNLPFWKKHRILVQQCNIGQKVREFFHRKKKTR